MEHKGSVHVMYHAGGIAQGCRLCRKILFRGCYAIAVVIGDQRYIVGMEPHPICCGEAKESLMLLFETEAEAAAGADRVIETYGRDGSIDRIPLLQMVLAVPAAAGACC